MEGQNTCSSRGGGGFILLFCLTIHKLCAKIKLEFVVFYLDDGTLGDHRDVELQDMMTI